MFKQKFFKRFQGRTTDHKILPKSPENFSFYLKQYFYQAATGSTIQKTRKFA